MDTNGNKKPLGMRAFPASMGPTDNHQEEPVEPYGPSQPLHIGLPPVMVDHLRWLHKEYADSESPDVQQLWRFLNVIVEALPDVPTG